jgi:hypothetical protein
MNVQELIDALGAIEDKTRAVRIPNWHRAESLDALNHVYAARPATGDGTVKFTPDVVLVSTPEVHAQLAANDGVQVEVA